MALLYDRLYATFCNMQETQYYITTWLTELIDLVVPTILYTSF